MDADRSLLRIIRSFELDDIRDVRRIKKGVYKLTSRTEELLCLKRMRYSEKRLRWMDRTLGEMRQAGFREVAWRNPRESIGKHLFVKQDRKDHPYILTHWLSGRTPSASSTEDMWNVASTLARFHKTSRSINISSEGLDNWLGHWPERLQERTMLLKHHIDKAKQRAKRRERVSKMDKLLTAHGDHLLKRAHSALQLLQKSEYSALCKRASRRLTLVHGDSGPKNFVLTKSGAHLIDFETLRVDLRVYDLYRLIRLCSKENGWNFAVARAILEGYRSVSPLESSEYDLLRVWLYFPQKAFRMLRRSERANGTEKRDKLASKLCKMLKEDAVLSEFLEELKEYARKE